VTATNLLIGVLVLGLVIWQQLIPRRVRSSMRIVLVLAVIGLIQTGQYLQSRTSMPFSSLRSWAA
jgi:hypothetical protein